MSDVDRERLDTAHSLLNLLTFSHQGFCNCELCQAKFLTAGPPDPAAVQTDPARGYTKRAPWIGRPAG